MLTVSSGRNGMCALIDVEFYHAVFQVVGRSTVLQNDQAVTLDVGDVALVDSTRPVTFSTMHRTVAVRATAAPVADVASRVGTAWAPATATEPARDAISFNSFWMSSRMSRSLVPTENCIQRGLGARMGYCDAG
jgi:hypothetical protein